MGTRIFYFSFTGNSLQIANSGGTRYRNPNIKVEDIINSLGGAE